MTDEIEERMTAWLNSQRIESANKYAQEGRRLGSLTTEEVKEKWAEGMRAWGKDPFNRPKLVDDADAELALRGLEQPPIETVQEAWEAIKAASLKRYQEAMADPDLLERMGQGIRHDMEVFFDAAKKANA